MCLGWLSTSVTPGPMPGECPGGKQWLDCAQGPASCAELGALQGTDQTCHPGCYCPSGTFLLVSVFPDLPSLGPGQGQGKRMGFRVEEKARNTGVMAHLCQRPAGDPG